MPRRGQQERLHGSVNHTGWIYDLVAQLFDGASEVSEPFTHLLVQLLRYLFWIARFQSDHEHIHERRGHRHEAGLRAPGVMHRSPCHVARAGKIVAPYRQPIESGPCAAPEDELANLRVRAVCSDQQVIAAAGSVRETQMHLCPVIVDAVDREAESHADSAALCLRRQDIVQHGTRNAVNRRVFRSSDVGIRCTRLDASRIVAELPPHERRTALDACVGESQFRKRTQLVGWLNNSNAIDGPIALNFNDVGGDARTGKPDSGCQTAYATAYNEYSLNRGHANYSKFVPVGYALHTIGPIKTCRMRVSPPFGEFQPKPRSLPPPNCKKKCRRASYHRDYLQTR